MTLSTSYWRNVWRWLAGFGRLGALRYKPGWSARSPAWIAVYLIDYGAAVVLLGIGCQPISRWAGERDHQPWRALPGSHALRRHGLLGSATARGGGRVIWAIG